MIKRLLLITVMGTFLISCKAKKKVTYSKENAKTTSPSINKTFSKTTDEDILVSMPEDTGKFVRLEFETIQDYISVFSEIAQLEMETFGIPASITLAQGLLESGFGKGELALKTNNHFGIKCHTGWKGDYDFHDDDEKGECFRKYNHPMFSYRDHSLFLTSRSRYAFLFDFKNTDYRKWANGLKKAGYATDKKYPQKLISLIEKHDLAKYDKAMKTVGYERKPAVVALLKKPTTSKETAIHEVKQGDTLYSISRKYSVSIDDLKRWNYMYTDTLSIGQKLTVEIEKFN